MYGLIEESLRGIGIADPGKVIIECDKVIKRPWNVIKKRFLHSKEEAALVTIYTYEDKKNPGMSPYRIINKMLWEDTDIQSQMSDQNSYLRLQLRAFRKLPRTKPQTLYRGIKNDKHEYRVDEELGWKGFSSTSTSMKATQTFLEDKTTKKICGTLFEIRSMWGYDVSSFSKYPSERGKANKNEHGS